MASGSGGGGGGGREWEGDWERERERQREVARGLRVECACGAGPCSVKPLRLNPRFLFLCCPRGQACAGGCGFMQWRDTRVLHNISTSPSSYSFDAPPPPGAMLPCPCGAGPCSVGIASNNRTFYSCSACKFKKWCDAGAPNACYICREEGHWSSDCPRLPLSAAATAASTKICFYCKSHGHFAACCPLKLKHPPTRN